MSFSLPPGSRLSCDYSVSEGIGTVVLWVILSIVTLGLALFVAPYYILKSPINRTMVVGPQGQVLGRLSVEVNLGDALGHAILWVILTVITLGLAMVLYQFSVIKRVLNSVVIT